jgi:hypothetical protein
VAGRRRSGPRRRPDRVGRWLRHWLDIRTKIRPTTRFHYTRDVENVLIPHLGRYRLAHLDAQLLRTVFAQIAATTNSKGRPRSASAMQHLRTTLRAALNLAVRDSAVARPWLATLTWPRPALRTCLRTLVLRSVGVTQGSPLSDGC